MLSPRQRRKSSIGLGFTGDPYGVRKLAEFAQVAEKCRYDSFYMCEDYYLRDAISTLACVAHETKRLRLSTGVVNPYTRNPVLIALTMGTLNELSKGRMILTIGTGVQPLLESMGVKFEHPLGMIKDSVEIIRRVQSGKRVDYSGELLSVKAVKLGDNPYFGMDSFKPSKYPIFVAGIGPKMLQLAGRIGDGSLFSAGFAVVHARDAVSNIRLGAESAGRPFGDLEIACYILSCLGRPSKAIKKFAAYEIAYSKQEFLDQINVPLEEALKLRRTLETKGELEAMGLLSDDVISSVSACGSKAEIQSMFEEYRKVGVTTPVLVPLETRTAELIASIS